MVWDKFLKGTQNIFLFKVYQYDFLFFLIEGKKISDEDKQGVYWQIIMPLFLSNRDVCCFFSL